MNALPKTIHDQLPEARAGELVRLGNLTLHVAHCLRGLGFTAESDALHVVHKRLFGVLRDEAAAVAEGKTVPA